MLPARNIPVYRRFGDLPKVVRRAVFNARQRYWAAKCKPAVEVPTCCLLLFRASELTDVAIAGCWPLPPVAIDYIKETRADRQRRRHRIENAIARVLAEKGPAVRRILGLDNGRSRRGA